MKGGGYSMGWPVRVYIAVHKGERKVEIPVFDIQGRCYSAVMIPLDRSDKSLLDHYQDYRIRHEVGKTIEEAVAYCEKWIKENLWDDVKVLEEQTPQNKA